MAWKHFQHYWSFVTGIHWSLVDSPHKGACRVMRRFDVSLMWHCRSHWTNSQVAGGLMALVLRVLMLYMLMWCYYNELSPYDDITWTSCSLKSPAIQLFIQQLMQIHIKETSKSMVLALCEGSSPVTGEFPSQRASDAEKASIWWRHHEASR